MKKSLLLFTFSFLMAGVVSLLSAAEEVMSPAYRAIWNDNVQKEIDARIEKNRKADFSVSLQNVKKGSDVKIDQISHKFRFGAHIFNFNQLGSYELNKKYKEVYGTLFNTATVGFYWKTFEPVPGKPRFEAKYEDSEEFWNACKEPKKQPHWRRPASDPVVDFCESKGLQMNGHPLIWGNRTWHHPEWLTKDPNKVGEMAPRFEKRIKEIALRYKARINRYDVVNESAEDFQRGNDTSRYGLMPSDYVFKAFKDAKKYFPASVQFNINEYAVNDNYAKQIQSLEKRGAKIDIVGIQMHLFNPKQTLDIAKGKPIQTPDVQKTRLTAADKGKHPLHISEITITAPGDDRIGRAIQAEVARNLYRYWFSWPTVMGITWWNIVDDCGAPGEPTTSGLFTRQMDPKPSFFALNDLINKEWKSSFIEKADQENVSFKLRGFKGDYKITWTAKDGTVKTKTVKVD